VVTVIILVAFDCNAQLIMETLANQPAEAVS